MITAQTLVPRGRHGAGLGCVKGGRQPQKTLRAALNDIKTARRQAAPAQKIVLRRPNNALLLDPAHAGRATAKLPGGTAAHLYENQSAVRRAHHQVNLAAATPRRPIIARQKAQTARLQIGQRLVFRCIANAFAARLVLIARKKAFL